MENSIGILLTHLLECLAYKDEVGSKSNLVEIFDIDGFNYRIENKAIEDTCFNLNESSISLYAITDVVDEELGVLYGLKVSESFDGSLAQDIITRFVSTYYNINIFSLPTLELQH